MLMFNIWKKKKNFEETMTICNVLCSQEPFTLFFKKKWSKLLSPFV